jgi:predicted AAA+ superfamily ATPase
MQIHKTDSKVLVGQRRVGKSYILRQIASQLISIGIPAKNIFYINKEFIEFDFLTTYTELEETVNAYKASLKPKGKFYLFIDEIRMIKGWEHFVNSHSQDFSEPCEIFITGSNSEMLSGELATLLAGRYVKLEIFPFSYAEYLGITKNKNPDGVMQNIWKRALYPNYLCFPTKKQDAIIFRP